jgi:hypothetical protein
MFWKKNKVVQGLTREDVLKRVNFLRGMMGAFHQVDFLSPQKHQSISTFGQVTERLYYGGIRKNQLEGFSEELKSVVGVQPDLKDSENIIVDDSADDLCPIFIPKGHEAIYKEILTVAETLIFDEMREKHHEILANIKQNGSTSIQIVEKSQDTYKQLEALCMDLCNNKETERAPIKRKTVQQDGVETSILTVDFNTGSLGHRQLGRLFSAIGRSHEIQAATTQQPELTPDIADIITGYTTGLNPRQKP